MTLLRSSIHKINNENTLDEFYIKIEIETKLCLKNFTVLPLSKFEGFMEEIK